SEQPSGEVAQDARQEEARVQVERLAEALRLALRALELLDLLVDALELGLVARLVEAAARALRDLLQLGRVDLAIAGPRVAEEVDHVLVAAGEDRVHAYLFTRAEVGRVERRDRVDVVLAV